MNKLKLIIRIGIFALIFFACAGEGFAQHNHRGDKGKSPAEMRKEVEEFKIKFIAGELDLKEDQKERFVEVYTQMNNERIKVFEQTRALERKIKKNPNATDAEYAAVAKAITEAREKDADIEKKYDAIFATFLTSKQIFKIKTAEDQFRRKMHEMYHKKRRDSHGATK